MLQHISRDTYSLSLPYQKTSKISLINLNMSQHSLGGDLESGKGNDVRHNKGYERLAAYMAWNPALAIFSRFRSANMLALLLLQAEITELEEALYLATAVDNVSNDTEKRERCSNWKFFRESGPGSEQWMKAQQLKQKITEYSK
jgi:hypothetical protein